MLDALINQNVIDLFFYLFPMESGCFNIHHNFFSYDSLAYHTKELPHYTKKHSILFISMPSESIVKELYYSSKIIYMFMRGDRNEN